MKELKKKIVKVSNRSIRMRKVKIWEKELCIEELKKNKHLLEDSTSMVYNFNKILEVKFNSNGKLPHFRPITEANMKSIVKDAGLEHLVNAKEVNISHEVETKVSTDYDREKIFKDVVAIKNIMDENTKKLNDILDNAGLS